MNRMQSEPSVAPTGRRRANPEAVAAKRQARRRQLIDATIDCISRKGIVDTTVPDIARAADMLDVPPRRVRAALRSMAHALAQAHGTLDDLLRAAEEPPEAPG